MEHEYAGVKTRFLNPDERLFTSDEKEMPLVLEADKSTDLAFLQNFIADNSEKLIADISKYGAVLLRGFEITTDEAFEKTMLSMRGFQGISEAFMSEHGRIHVGNLKYVLHTNAVYKTGGTLYLGGFHSENYYTPDVPSYIYFCCYKPSLCGGETGLVNMEKVYEHLEADLKERLEKKPFFVSKWLVSEAAERYQLSEEKIEEICKQFNLPIVGNGSEKFILMYKPSIFEHPITKKKALQINLFELLTLNAAMRKCFINDYKGKTWFWHRLVWRLPSFVFTTLEFIYVTCASFIYSPKESFNILKTKLNTFMAEKNKKDLPPFDDVKVGSCFTEKNVKNLAKLIRSYYSSCLWKSGDILLVDNKKVAHAGMPGAGPRLVRAMISNPIDMSYTFMQSGTVYCKERETGTVGYYMTMKESNVSAPAKEEETTL